MSARDAVQAEERTEHVSICEPFFFYFFFRFVSYLLRLCRGGQDRGNHSVHLQRKGANKQSNKEPRGSWVRLTHRPKVTPSSYPNGQRGSKGQHGRIACVSLEARAAMSLGSLGGPVGARCAVQQFGSGGQLVLCAAAASLWYMTTQ